MDTSELYVTASLASLDLTPEEVPGLAKAVEQMLDYFSKMEEFDVGDLEATTHALLVKNRLRHDLESTQNSSDELLARAPELEDRFIVIPNVL